MTESFSLGETLKKYVKKPSEMTKPELVLLYSRPGGGKTHLGASASDLPEVKRMLIIDTEGSTAGTVVGFDEDKIDIVPVHQIEMFDAIMKQLFDPEVANEYDAVQIDTFDVAQKWKVRQLKAKYGSSGDAVFKVWEEVSDWTLDIGRGLKAMKALGIIVFHDREEKNADGALLTKLQLQGSAKDIFPGIPDVVAYLERKVFAVEGSDGPGEEHTVAYFASDDNKVTKNRFGFPPHMLDPSFTKMYTHIADRLKNKTEESTTNA